MVHLEPVGPGPRRHLDPPIVRPMVRLAGSKRPLVGITIR
jgi:hypothetical protein